MKIFMANISDCAKLGYMSSRGGGDLAETIFSPSDSANYFALLVD